MNLVIVIMGACRHGVKYLFFLYRNLSLPLILFITFKSIASPDKFLSNSLPKYVTFEYCLILTSPLFMSRVPIILFLFLVEKMSRSSQGGKESFTNTFSSHRNSVVLKIFPNDGGIYT